MLSAALITYSGLRLERITHMCMALSEINICIYIRFFWIYVPFVGKPGMSKQKGILQSKKKKNNIYLRLLVEYCIYICMCVRTENEYSKVSEYIIIESRGRIWDCIYEYYTQCKTHRDRAAGNV